MLPLLDKFRTLDWVSIKKDFEETLGFLQIVTL